VLAYEHVKHHLVEQLAERQRALGHLTDTRFAYLVAFLVEQMARLQAKYEVSNDPVERLDELRDVLRDVNARLTGRTLD